VEHRLNTLGRQQWHVQIRERSPDGQGVLISLARYLRGGPIASQRVVSGDGQRVVLRYAERANGPGDQATQRTLGVPIAPCMGRFLRHVPPGRAVLVRCWGLYAHTYADALAHGRQQLGQDAVAGPGPEEGPSDSRPGAAADPERCPVCGQRLVCTARMPRAGAPPPTKTEWEQVACGGGRPWPAGSGPEGPRCGLRRGEAGLWGEDALQEVPAPSRFSCPQPAMHGTFTSRRSATG
jgi:hypothetical protein